MQNKGRTDLGIAQSPPAIAIFIAAPPGVSRLVKSIKKSLYSEKEFEKIRKRMDRDEKEKENQCPKCGHENPKSSKFCNSCGKKLTKQCTKCNNENPSDSSFCNKCGMTLE